MASILARFADDPTIKEMVSNFWWEASLGLTAFLVLVVGIMALLAILILCFLCVRGVMRVVEAFQERQERKARRQDKEATHELVEQETRGDAWEDNQASRVIIHAKKEEGGWVDQPGAENTEAE